MSRAVSHAMSHSIGPYLASHAGGGAGAMRGRSHRYFGLIPALAIGLALAGCVASDGSPQAEELPPTATPRPLPTPTLVPVAGAAPPIEMLPPGAPPASTPEPPAPTPEPPVSQPAPLAAAQGSIRLDDADWQGGFRNPGGYRGRSATWIYGSTTRYSSMEARFTIDSQPAGTATLSVEGMDSEGRAKTPISIVVNGVEIYNGPNPLPDDQYPFQVGTWATETWSFDGALLRPGENVIRISNIAPGAFSLPPFFMLDYAIVSFELP
jgi:hypothetical protein